MVEEIGDMAKASGGNVMYVELNADLDTRLVRNRTENRLLHKRLQRENLEGADAFIARVENEHVFQTDGQYPPPFPEC